MKTCIKCNIEKPFINFSVAKGNRDGFSNKCKECTNDYVKIYTIKNKDKVSKQRKEYREINKERLSKKDVYIILTNKICSKCSIDKPIGEFNKRKSTKDGYRFDCRICQSNEGKEYNKNNLEKRKKYRTINKDKFNLKNKIKKKINIQYNITCKLRTRLWNAIKDDYKSGSAVSDLGCSIDEFKIYVEQQFDNGMSWDNWGRHTWHLDHKIPLSSFDLTDREQLLKAVHYTNLQPMWALENLEKGAKILS